MQPITCETLVLIIRNLDYGERCTIFVDPRNAEQAWQEVRSRSYLNGGPLFEVSKEIVDNCLKIDFRFATIEEYLD